MKPLLLTLLLSSALYAESTCWYMRTEKRAQQVIVPALIVFGVNELLYHTGMVKHNRALISGLTALSVGAINLNYKDVGFNAVGTGLSVGFVIVFGPKNKGEK